MNVKNLRQNYLLELFSWIRGKDILFKQYSMLAEPYQKGKVLLRHDVDDKLMHSVAMAELQHKHGVKATYFILDTAPYWDSESREMWDALRHIKALGHEIAWHNNAITVWLKSKESPNLYLSRLLAKFRMQDLQISGSASHGDALCHKHGYINYDIFEECERTKEALSFPKNYMACNKTLSMKDHQLRHEAYHVPYDHYFSESGGTWKILPEAKDFFEKQVTTQILIHPQWWTKQLGIKD